jgi:5-methyltetrahydrofolate--homocysteine methyltransferase
MIGLSGLITPSLDEMVHVAREMKREGFDLPLLIGGATTSKAHTAVKIAPNYEHGVVHVLDASRAVGVVGSLINREAKGGFVNTIRAEYEKIRTQHQGHKDKPLLSVEEARKRRTRIEWKPEDIAKPSFTGVRVLEGFPLEELVKFIDWSPFFHAWELRGRYPAILDNPKAKELFDDAQQLLGEIVSKRLLRARGVYGFFRANSVGDDVQLAKKDGSTESRPTFHFLRQQMDKGANEANYCLADFIASKESGLGDYLGAFAVTAGFGVEELCKKFERDHDDYNSIMTKALADRLAEAFAECLHKKAREDWGFGKTESLSHEDLIRERYRGIRPAAGYPACPDHAEKATLWQLLDAEKNTGIRLTESFAMWPGASVSGLYFAHPSSKYFAINKIGRDQAIDYHLRKGITLQEVEKWLGPYLDYEPGTVGSAATCACGVRHPST